MDDSTSTDPSTTETSPPPSTESAPDESTATESPRTQTPAPTDSIRAFCRWVWTTDRIEVAVLRELGQTLMVVAVIAAALFAMSGVWPPLVAVSSGSMEPHMTRGDLVIIAEPDRYVSDAAVAETGIVTHHVGRDVGYHQFGAPGDVVVYAPDGHHSPHIIHRAMFYVEEGENWYAQADKQYLGSADSCADLQYCPAPHDGFITKGDANMRYDQVGTTPISAPVKPTWIRGRGLIAIPHLGRIRLLTLHAERTAPDIAGLQATVPTRSVPPSVAASPG